MPLFAIWRDGTPLAMAWAVAHCLLGDVGIALVALSLALIIAGDFDWPTRRSGIVAATAIVLSVGYTIYSEYVNVVVRQAWAYLPAMPTLPGLGTGVVPLLQWIVVPGVSLAWSGRWGPFAVQAARERSVQ